MRVRWDEIQPRWGDVVRRQFEEGFWNEVEPRVNAALRDLKQLAVNRAQAETEVEAGFKARNDAADRELHDAQNRIQAAFTAAHTSTEQERAAISESANARFDAEHGACSEEYAAK